MFDSDYSDYLKDLEICKNTIIKEWNVSQGKMFGDRENT